MEVKNPDKGFASELKKVISENFFEKVNFGAPEASISVKNSFFSIYQYLKVTRRAGCLIPTRRVIRMQGNLHFRGLQHIGEVKDLKSKFEGGSCIQILI